MGCMVGERSPTSFRRARSRTARCFVAQYAGSAGAHVRSKYTHGNLMESANKQKPMDVKKVESKDATGAVPSGCVTASSAFSELDVEKTETRPSKKKMESATSLSSVAADCSPTRSSKPRAEISPAPLAGEMTWIRTRRKLSLRGRRIVVRSNDESYEGGDSDLEFRVYFFGYIIGWRETAGKTVVTRSTGNSEVGILDDQRELLQRCSSPRRLHELEVVGNFR